MAGPCPHCAITIQSPALPVEPSHAALAKSALVAPPLPVSPTTTGSEGIQPRGGSRPPKINIRSVSSIDWASEDAREASRRVRSDVGAAERIDHRIEKVTKSDRFENVRAILSVIAVATMAGTIFFMAKTGWGNPESSVAEPVNEPVSTTQYVSSQPPTQSPKAYPWREPLPEVKRDEDDPFFNE